MSDREDAVEHPNAEDARLIGAYLSELILGNPVDDQLRVLKTINPAFDESKVPKAIRPSDDRYRVLESISYLTGSCYGGEGVPRSIFARGLVDPSVYRPLLENPAAGPLLAYIINALATFDFGEADSEHTTAQRRAALSKAFCLTGEKGEKWLPMVERMALKHFFSWEMQKALRGREWATKKEEEKAVEEARRACLKETFLRHHKTAYDSTDETHKTQRAELIKMLDNTPPFPESQGEKE